MLGYFGRPPLPPDPAVVAIAREQLKLEPFDGNPLDAAPDSLAKAREALASRHLPLTDENVFLVAAAIVPGKDIELNEGLRLLTGKAKISLPLRKKEEPVPAAVQAASTPAPAPQHAPAPAPTRVFSGPVTTVCTVVEGATSRRFRVTIEPTDGVPLRPAATADRPSPVSASVGSSTMLAEATPVFSPFEGKTELVEVKVRVGDTVAEGQVVAAVEAMKAKHDVRAPRAGQVISIDADVGTTVMGGNAIMTIGG